MKKLILFSLLFTFLSNCYGQLQLEEADLNALVDIGEYYSHNNMLKGDTVLSDLEKFRTPKLNQIVNTLQTQSKYTFEILEEQYLKKPSDDDLLMWFVIREIHYNLKVEKGIPLPSVEVAKKYLASPPDYRWQVDNYYYRLHAPVAMLFNSEDFSKLNFDLDAYGLENDFEKAAFYFNFLNAFVTRFRVLAYMKNYDKLLEYAKKMPKINGKEYFYYQEFKYEDFKWIGHEKEEMYNERHIRSLYSTLNEHSTALVNSGQKEKVQEIYLNSIMTNPNYFKYSGYEKELEKLYKKVNKRQSK